MAAIDSIVARLSGVKRQSGGGFIARCPAHDDQRQSLSVNEGDDGRVLVKCHAGCSVERIVGALGLTTADLFAPSDRPQGREMVAQYPYEDEQGNLLFEVVRYSPKDFRQRKPNGSGGWDWKTSDVRKVLYRLPQVRAAIEANRVILVVEGEKDVHNLARSNIVATTSPGGAGKWRDEYADSLAGARVVIIPDNDEVGREHAQAVLDSLTGKAAQAAILNLPGLPPKGDVSDWLGRSGNDARRLADLVMEALAAAAPQSRSTTVEVAFFETLEDIQRRRSGTITGLSWPHEWTQLAETVGPLEPGSFTVVAARPSVGKTMFGMQLQKHLCNSGHSVLYVSRELSKVRMIRRHMVSFGANIYHLRTGQIDSRDQQAIDAFQDASKGWRLWIDDASRTTEDIASEISILKPDAVIIDYLQRLAYDTESEYAAITRIVNDLQDITLDYKVPVVCLSQLARPLKGQEHKPPRMSDTRGSGAVEERATNLIMLHRRWSTTKDGHGQDITKSEESGLFLVEKCADGEAGTLIDVVYQGAKMRILEEVPR